MIVTTLIALAAWRVWRLAALDGITDGLRFRLLPEGSKRAELVSCPWCLGMWITAAIWAITWAVVDSFPLPWLVLGAASALTGAFGTADKGWHERG